jgi:serine/threonine protein kinase
LSNERTDSFAVPVPDDEPKPAQRTQEEDTVLEPGTQVGKYEIIRFLAEGGMGIVYHAKHTLLLSQHAIKVVRKTFANQKEFTTRFRREARIMAALEHPNIVRVTDFGEHEGMCYYVMDYVAGPDGPPRTLEDEIKIAVQAGDRPGIPQRRARDIGLQVCNALAYAHGYSKEGVAHLDLKPSNIMIVGESSVSGYKMPVKVTDFGFAKILGRESMLKSIAISQSTDIQSKAMITGTPRYMSPEQWKGEQEAGPASDIYALGTIMYEAMIGKVPQEVYPAKPPSSFGCAEDWDHIIEKCLRNNPMKRYPSADKLADDLRKIRFVQFQSAREKKKKRRRFRRVAVLLGMLFLIGVIGAALIHLGVIDEATVDQSKLAVSQQIQKGRKRIGSLLKPPGFLNVRSDPAVNITIFSETGEVFKPGSTDSFGHKTGIRLAEGVYYIVMERNPYYPMTNRIVIVPGEIATLDRKFPESQIDPRAADAERRKRLFLTGSKRKPGRIRILCNVPEAEIYSGDELIGKAGEILSLPTHIKQKLEIRAPGHKSKTVDVTLTTPGVQADDLKVELVEWGPVLRITATPPEGYWRKPRAKILIDGKSVGQHTLPKVWEGLSAGTHTVSIAPGPWKPIPAKEVTLEKGHPVELNFNLELMDSYLAFDVDPQHAVIYVNGRKQTSRIVKVRPDSYHEIRIWAKGYEAHSDRVKVDLGSTNTVAITLQRKGSRR